MCQLTDKPRALAEQLAQVLVDHCAACITIPVYVGGHSITVIVKYADECEPLDVDDVLIDTGGIY